jgi:hypothetical protein
MGRARQILVRQTSGRNEAEPLPSRHSSIRFAVHERAKHGNNIFKHISSGKRGMLQRRAQEGKITFHFMKKQSIASTENLFFTLLMANAL